MYRVLRQIVKLHDENAIKVKSHNASDPPTFDDGTMDGFQLPSHKDLVEAFVACQKAKQFEETQ